jgi:hypothetical protein
MKLSTALLTFSLLGTAPFQCASREDPNHRIEDTPAEALWSLSERFRADGNDAARRTTLEQLVEQYPGAREAERARLVLSGREVAPDEPTATEPANEQAEARTAPPNES